jgi:hypothetical protein
MWYLSFDCASKTLGWSLVEIDEAQKLTQLKTMQTFLEKKDYAAADRMLQQECHIKWHAGSVVDLLDGAANKSVHTPERVRKLKKYVKDHIKPTLLQHAAARGCATGHKGAPPDLHILVEYQSINNSSEKVSTALLTCLASYGTIAIVGPAAKNKVWVRGDPESRHCNFMRKYSASYSANKAHAVHLMKTICADLNIVQPAVPKKVEKDLADSFIQIFGFLQFGDTATPEENY